MDKTIPSTYIENANIAVIGLGYVGLPLAIEFAKKYNVLGFDIKVSRIKELNEGEDETKEANLEDLKLVVKNQREVGDSLKGLVIFL